MKKLLIFTILFWVLGSVFATNTVSLTSAQGHPGDTVEIHLSLNNSDAVVAFQTEIALNNSLVYVPNSCLLSSRCNQHQVTASVINGVLKILIYNFSLTSFTGDSGDLCTFKLVLGREPATYTLTPTNTILSSAAGQALPLNGTTGGSVILLSAKMQLNGNNINYGHIPIRSTYNGGILVSNVGNEPLVISALNFTDNTFSSTSVPLTIAAGSSATLNVSFAPVNPGPVNERVTIVSNSATGNQQLLLLADPFSVNEIHVINVSGNSDSIVEVSLSLNNMDSIVGLQCQFRLPNALEYVPGSFSLNNGRKRDHTAISGFHGDTLILAAFSFNNMAFHGGDGIVASFRLKLVGQSGSYLLHHISPILSDANGTNVLSASYDGNVTVRSPRISCSNILTFGHTSVTDTIVKTLPVYNYGNAPLTLQQASFMQPGCYVQEPFPIVIANSQSTMLHVCYTGTQDGNFSTTMQLYSNDPENGLKNINLSGSRYEPNGIALSAPTGISFHDNVTIDIDMNNYSAIAGVQLDFQYPYEDYSVAASDFSLSGRSSGHNITAVALNDSVYRVLVFSMQNTPFLDHTGAIIHIHLHPKPHTAAGTFPISLANVVLSDQSGINRLTEAIQASSFTTIIPSYTVEVNQIPGGTVSGNIGEFTENTAITLLATPSNCSSFIQWQDGNTDNPRTFILTQDTVFTPTFNAYIIYNEFSAQACESYTWNGQIYTESGNYEQVLQAVSTCDSIVTLHLTVYHPDTVLYTGSVCQGEEFTGFGFHFSAQETHSPGILNTSSTSISLQTSCDSVTILTLTVLPVDTIHLTATVCQGESYNGLGFYLPADSTLYPRTVMMKNINSSTLTGCDSITILQLVVNAVDTSYFSETICQGEPFSGYGFSIPSDSTLIPGLMVRSRTITPTSGGCDSIIILSLNIKAASFNEIYIDACDSLVWNNIVYSQSGDYTQVFSAANGCDSTVIMHLTIHQSYDFEINDAFCNGTAYIFGGMELYWPGDYEFYGQTSYGCDSIITLHLSMNQTTSSYFNETICNEESYNFYGQQLTESGTYFHHLQTVAGCDSTIVLQLTKGITTYGFISHSMCAGETFYFNGIALTEAGTYYDTIPNYLGCDSIIELTLTVFQSVSNEIYGESCDTYYWNGETYYQSGDYIQHFSTIHGCDSTVILHLTIHQSANTSFSAESEDSYIWNGETYYQSGDYVQHFTTTHGCDSTVTLHLTITVNVNEYNQSRLFSVFPNPSNGVVNIQAKELGWGITEIRVFDNNGKFIFKQNEDNVNSVQIDLSSFAQGIYYIELTNDKREHIVVKAVKR